jgi:hypothetical protein
MQRYTGSVLRKFDSSTDGNIAKNVQVTIRKSSDNTLASLYSVNSTSSPQLPNPLVTDVNGQYTFFAEDGKYDITFNNGAPSLLGVQLLDSDSLTPEATPEMFGAVGDDQTNDYLALQLMLDSYATEGRDFLFPTGKTYFIGNNTLRHKGGNISGYGASIRRTQANGNNTPVLITHYNNDWSMKGLRLVGGYTQAMAAAGTGIGGPSTPTMGEDGAGIVITGSDNVTFEDVTVEDVWGDSIYMSGFWGYDSPADYPVAVPSPSGTPCTNITMVRCKFINPMRGTVTGTDAIGITIRDNYHYKTTQYVGTILFEPNFNVPQTSRNILIDNNEIDTRFIGVVFTSGGTLTKPIENITVSNNKFKAFAGVYVTSTGTKDVFIDNNDFKTCTRVADGFRFNTSWFVQNAKNVHITNNVDQMESTADFGDIPLVRDCQGVVFSGNTCRGNRYNKPLLNVINSSGLNISNNVTYAIPAVTVNAIATFQFYGTVKGVVFKNNINLGGTTDYFHIYSLFGGDASVCENFIIEGNYIEVPDTTYPLIIDVTAGVEVWENTYKTNPSREAMVFGGGDKVFRHGTGAGKFYVETWGTEIPTSGFWRQGDKVWKLSPTDADHIGWVCVSAGTVGQWRPFGFTDEIISNSDGLAIKSGSGWLECIQSLASGAITTASGSSFVSGNITWTYPVAFAAASVPSISSWSSVANSWVVGAGSLPSNTSVVVRAASTVTNGTGGQIFLTAHGRWK